MVDNICINISIFNVIRPDSLFASSDMMHGHLKLGTPGRNMSLLLTVFTGPFSPVFGTDFKPKSNSSRNL